MTQDIHFKVSTSIKTIIGKELVTNPYIAIFELVKNSYDASSSHSWIIFENIKSGMDSRIIIVDDGIGMSKENLENNWLFVGYSEKKEREDRPKSDLKGRKRREHRVFAGAKGIGRFSCDTLGSKLALHTKTRNEEAIHRLDIDWTRFERDQTEQFQRMTATYTTEKNTAIQGFDLSRMRSGTILEITQLRDVWSVNSLRNLKRYLQRLVNPSISDTKSQDFIIEVRAPEFLEQDREAQKSPKLGPVINGHVENFVFQNLGIKTTMLYSRIDEYAIVTRLLDKDKLVFELREKNIYKDLKKIETRIFFLNKAAKTAFTKTMGMSAKEYGSVFLYKNQFRIHPYGDEGDDWLGLEERKGQGYNRYLSKREIIGTVILRDSQPMFKEVSSRDGGVIRNRAFWDLTEFVRTKVLRRLERYVGGVIDWDKAEVQGTEDRQQIDAKSLELVSKIVEGTRGPETSIKVGPALLQTFDRRLISNYPGVIENLLSLKEHVKGSKEQALLDTAIRSARRILSKSESDRTKLTSSLAAREQEILFLKGQLSPEKEATLRHIHWIKVSAEKMQPSLASFQEWAKQTNAPANIADALGDSALELQKILVLSKIITHANFDLGQEELETDIVNYVRQYLEKFGKSPMDVLRPIQFYGDEISCVTLFKPVSIAIILDNLLDNSRKNGATVASLKFEKAGKDLHIFFGDNGRGIEEEANDQLFQIGYSTTGGSGLGLYEIKKLMRDQHGDILFIGNDKKGVGTGACFEMIFH